ncbi:prostamide/prostaglandin F synthase-like isoform X2 [Sebastes umbrosus]|uniref:prostamide/prostaglandin F synthase-like isoform X2 n=1 Tax=Sebastes umbrosus TaxID=72105 RepID=UPI0018A09403|nr:prostamide/prostaglandin F synthase-like isoform X2 [Sebastes umbrosus]
MSERADATAVKALTAFVEEGKALLDLAEKESREGSLQEFIRQKIRIEQTQSLLGLIEAAAALYRSCAALRDAVQDFQQLEVQWDAFLQRLDDELQLSAEILDKDYQSKCISPDTSLIDARTGETLILEKYLGKGKKILLVLIRQFSCLLCRLHLKDLEKNQRSFDAHSIEVVVVSFGCQEGASHWLQQTSCQFDMLLDPERKMYTAFGLGASLKKVLNFSNMLLYAEYVVDNMEFPRGLPSIQDDMFQLGGDFLLDEHGRVLFSHCCQSPIDRPSAEDILSAQ